MDGKLEDSVEEYGLKQFARDMAQSLSSDERRKDSRWIRWKQRKDELGHEGQSEREDVEEERSAKAGVSKGELGGADSGGGPGYDSTLPAH